MSNTDEVRFFYDRQEVANYLGISRMTLARWERVLAIPSNNFVGAGYHIRTHTTKVDAWIAELEKLACQRRLKSRYRIRRALMRIER